MKLIRSIRLIINYKTFILTGLAVLSTHLCTRYNLTAAFPEMLVSIAIVFPVVFSIGSAFTRRENALRNLSEFHGNILTAYFAMRDWSTGENDVAARFKCIIHEILIKIKAMFATTDESELKIIESSINEYFSQLSALAVELKNYGVQGTEVSRINQYISKIIIAFYNIRVIHHYRTPVTLRAYSKFFIYIFPVVYGPYFANDIHEFSPYLEFVMPVLWSFILVSLDNIQDHLEHPFDNVGEDDIMLDPDEAIECLKG
jgi:hypothetical protein